MLGSSRRLLLMAEGCFTPLDAKTAVGVLRYREGEVVAVLDSTRAGRTAQECVGAGGDRPVVADLAAAARLGADSLLIGTAPQGGGLSAGFRSVVREALERGWDVLSGLHVFLADDPELSALAAARGARLLDARRPPRDLTIATGRAADVDALVVLTVGTDCNVGKMTTALEVRRELAARGVRASFVATGQTGIFIADSGVAVDAVPSDFVSGVVERLVLEAARSSDVVLVEGQGALHHPSYSGVTLGLLHGAAPAALLLCHQAGRTHIRLSALAAHDREIPPLAAVRAAYETAAGWIAPARVVGVALHTLGLDAAAARAACGHAVAALSVPATDPVRFGAGPLAQAVLEALERRRAARAAAPAPSSARSHAPHA